jgi:hypothetical protein
MPRLLTRRELAEQAGTSRQAVEKRLRSGHLTEIAAPDGSRGFDPDDPKVFAYIRHDSKPRRVAQRAREPAGGNDSNLPPRGELGGDRLHQPPTSDDLPLGDPNALDALKVAAQIHQIRLGTELKREKYIDRALVLRFFSRFIAIDESELKTLGDRLGSQLATEARRAPTEDDAAILCGRLVSDAMLKTLEHRKRRLREIRTELRTQAETEAANE